MREFICGESLDDDTIAAGLRAGVIKTYSIDADGRQWYRRVDAAMPTHRTIDPNKIDYVCESEMTEEEIRDGVMMGTLRFWRVDGNGKHWFTREVESDILGIPAGVKLIDGDEND